MSKLIQAIRPTFPEMVNENTARAVALQVFLLTIAAVFFHSLWILGFLAVEFLSRVLYGPRRSLMVFLAEKGILKLLKAERNPVPGFPKRIAQAIGFLFVTGATLAYPLTGSSVLSSCILSVLVLFSGLEAFLGFCAACFMVNKMARIGWLPETVCVKCNQLDFS